MATAVTPQGGGQNVNFAGGSYLALGELYRLGLLTTLFFLVVGTAWILLITW